MDFKCPYCEDVLTDWEHLNLHILEYHPEKSTLADYHEAKTSRIWLTATELTTMTLKPKQHNAKEGVLDTFKYFLRELMKSEGN